MLKPDTKGVLANSVKELLKDNSFTDIGVQDIVRYSQVSRTAFYNHFKDFIVEFVKLPKNIVMGYLKKDFGFPEPVLHQR